MQKIVDRLKNVVRGLKVNPAEPSLVVLWYYFALALEVTVSTEKSLHPFAFFACFDFSFLSIDQGGLGGRIHVYRSPRSLE